jgi:hypothetical protein
MNALAQLVDAEEIPSLDDFRECCAQQAWFYSDGLVPLQIAADNLQWLAERWDLISLYGQDAIQAEIALAFMPAPPSRPADCAETIARQWESADPRDRWRHTGEAPPLVPKPEAPAARGYRPPQATIDAFRYVARLGDADKLAAWLNQHPRDVPHLKKISEARCSIPAA